MQDEVLRAGNEGLYSPALFVRLLVELRGRLFGQANQLVNYRCCGNPAMQSAVKPLSQFSKELAKVVGKRGWLLHSGKVSASFHRGPAHDI